MEIKFAPGFFEEFEGTQEELDEIITLIQKMIDDDTLLSHSQVLTEEEFLNMSDSLLAGSSRSHTLH
jgi:hypothetical protein